MRNKHLTEKDFFDLYYEFEGKEPLLQHIRECGACKNGYEKFAKNMDIIKKDASADTLSKVSDGFFINQKANILSKALSGKERSNWLPLPKLLPIAIPFAVAVLVATLTMRKTEPTGRQAPSIVITKQDIEDDIFLREIDAIKEECAIEGVGLDDDDTDFSEQDDKGAFFMKEKARA